MSEELQGQEPVIDGAPEFVEDSTREPENNGIEATSEQAESDLAPDIKQESVQKAINKQHAKFREEERKRKELEKQLEELKAKIPSEPEPEIPEMPDQYDDNYDQKLKEWQEKVHQAAVYKANQELKLKAEQAEQRKLEEAKQREMQERIDKYSKRAEEAGIPSDQLQINGEIVASAGIAPDVAVFLLEDAQGAEIVNYLATNPDVLEDIAGMPTHKAIIKLHSDVRQNVKADVKNVTEAPEPVKGVQGKNYDTTSDLIKGATFE